MIVVTTDGSERSLHAIPHAALLARSAGCELGLLQVIDPEEIAAGSLNWPDRVRAAFTSTEGVLEALAATESVNARPIVGARYKGESTAQAIVRCSDENGAKLIAMDSRGHTAARHALLGSVAMGVLAAAEIPVMVTGPEVTPPEFADEYRVLVTSDGSKESENVLNALRPFLPRLRVGLLAVYVPRLGDAGQQKEVAASHERLAAMQRRVPAASRIQTMVRSVASFEHPEILAVSTARQIRANALAMSTHGYSAQRHVLLGSFAAACLGRSHIPVILARQ